jgi:sugar transferase (PEP-CTERM/EpsH1 system associated)
MKILLISPWFPSPPFGGALIRVYETLRYLSRRHRVTLIAPVANPYKPEQLAPLTDYCESVVAVPVSEAAHAVLRRLAMGLVRGMPFIQSLHLDRRLARSVRRASSGNDYDIIHVEHSFMAPYLAYVSGQTGARTVLSMHNIESLRFRRELQTMRWGARRLALLTDSVLFDSWEDRSIRRFDGIATVSKVEEEWVRKRAPDARVAIVPNGVDTEYFTPAPPPRSPRTIVFTGLMNYPPNADAAAWFSGAILPSIVARHPEVRFLIVGDKPTPEVLALARQPQVEVTGRVPDVRPYLANCAAVVVPLRSGAGTRLKILEAMAMERPVVSTAQGAEGLKTTDGQNILIGDTPQALANHLCALVESSELRARLGTAGRRLVEETYDWKACFGNLDALYRAVTSPGYSRPLKPVRELAS